MAAQFARSAADPSSRRGYHPINLRGFSLKLSRYLRVYRGTGQGAAVDTTTAAGKLVFGIFAALAEFERELIRERTIASLAPLAPAIQGAIRRCSRRLIGLESLRTEASGTTRTRPRN